MAKPRIRTLSPQTLQSLNDVHQTANWLRAIADELDTKDTDDYCIGHVDINWYTQEEIDHSIAVHQKKGIQIARSTPSVEAVDYEQ